MKKIFYTFSCLVLLLPLTISPPAHAGTRYEIGIATSASLLRMKENELRDRLRSIKDLGVTWIRVDFNWGLIQPRGPMEYEWELYDQVVNEAGAQNLKILAMLAYTPKWAQERHCKALVADETSAQRCIPRSSQEFGRFAGTAAARYKTKNVRGWEIWNEPNLGAYFKTAYAGKLSINPHDYARIANAAAAQIRPHTDGVIITGGMAPMFEPQPRKNMRQSDYLAKLLPYLRIDLFDGIGVHPYSWPLLPSRTAAYNAFYTVNNGRPKYNLRTIMANAGWGDKEIWGTEYGASTRGIHGETPTKHKRPDHVSEDKQAQIIGQGIDGWYKKPNVGPLFVHSDSDQWLYKKKNEGGFGLKRNDGSKKPAYNAFQAAVKRLQELR